MTDVLVAFAVGILCGIVAGMAIMATVVMSGINDANGGNGQMHFYSKGDVIRLKNSKKVIVVMEVFPENTGVWGLYRNSYGAIAARGYNSVFLGEVVGQVSIDGIEDALRID